MYNAGMRNQKGGSKVRVRGFVDRGLAREVQRAAHDAGEGHDWQAYAGKLVERALARRRGAVGLEGEIEHLARGIRG